jgi:hypothetical protein
LQLLTYGVFAVAANGAGISIAHRPAISVKVADVALLIDGQLKIKGFTRTQMRLRPRDSNTDTALAPV